MRIKLGDKGLSLAEAKMIFHEYYDRRSKSPEGRIKGKMMDIIYHRPEEFRLKPNTPSSIKYALPNGVSRYDMEDVDWFPVGETVCIEDPDFNKEKGNERCVKVQGERKLKDGTSFRDHFREVYKRRKEKGEFEGKNNLVDIKNYKEANRIVTKKHKRLLEHPLKRDGLFNEVNQFRLFECEESNNPIACRIRNIRTHDVMTYRIKLPPYIKNETNEVQYFYVDEKLDVYNREFDFIGNIAKGDIHDAIVRIMRKKGLLEDNKLTEKVLSEELKPLSEWFKMAEVDKIRKR